MYSLRNCQPFGFSSISFVGVLIPAGGATNFCTQYGQMIDFASPDAGYSLPHPLAHSKYLILCDILLISVAVAFLMLRDFIILSEVVEDVRM